MNVKTAAFQVLQKAGKAMHVKEITGQIIDSGIWQPKGKAPVHL